MEEKDSPKNNIVKKAQQLVESRYNLTAFEIKIISSLITMIKVSDTEFQEYAIKVLDWKNEKELKRKDIYEAFEDVADSLLRKPLTIRSENGDWIKANWVSSAQYKKGEGIVLFEISKKLKPYLLALKKHFLQYDIKNILPLRSAYVIRCYELLKDWYSTEIRYSKNKTVTKIISLVWIRQTFQIPTAYSYGMLKKRILLKAQADLPLHTDIKFKFEEIKEGHKVTHIKFFISAKEQKEKLDEAGAKQQLTGQKIGLFLAKIPEEYRSKAVERLLAKYEDRGEYVLKQIECTNKANPKNYGAYLAMALKNDYAGAEKSSLAEELAKKEKEKREQAARLAAEKRKAEEAKKRAAEEEEKEWEQKWEQLPAEEQEKYLAAVKEKSATARTHENIAKQLAIALFINPSLKTSSFRERM